MGFVKFEEAKRAVTPRGDKLAALARDDNMFALYSKMDQGTVKDWQHHTPVQFYYILSGTMELSIGEETMVLNPGDSAIVPPDVPHKAVMITDVEDIEVFNDPRMDVRSKWFGETEA